MSKTVLRGHWPLTPSAAAGMPASTLERFCLVGGVGSSSATRQGGANNASLSGSRRDGTGHLEREWAMGNQNAWNREDAAAEVPEETRGAPLGTRLRRVVNEDPWIAIGAGAAVGGVLGALVLQRAARLTFVAAMGYLAHGLWQRERALDIDDVIVRLDGRVQREVAR